METSETESIAIISDPEKIRIMLDETRLQILRVMRHGIQRQGEPLSYDYTVAEISDLLKTKPQRIYHHVDKLIAHGFLIKSKEEKKSRSTLAYYRRTANGFIISYDSDQEIEDLSNHNKDFMNNLLKVFEIELNEEEIAKTYLLLDELMKLESKIFKTLNDRITTTHQTNNDRIFNFTRFMMGIGVVNSERGSEIYQEFGKLLFNRLVE
ncbi:MAG: winged helix-turn-helix transcriptional regulator [Candidatus Heimdallarchaeota archaeon]|nr:winged helix-turn-helix transcriptional regulator [Candidatus Heimdallarchaeota archaeon]